ncbi:MAG: hypothetical protein DRO36_06630, partial [Candidatus Hecatellales archaeon]
TKRPYLEKIFHPVDRLPKNRQILLVFIFILLSVISVYETIYTQPCQRTLTVLSIVFTSSLISAGIITNRILTKIANRIRAKNEELPDLSEIVSASDEFPECALAAFKKLSEFYENIEENTMRDNYRKAYQILAIIMRKPSTTKELSRILWRTKRVDPAKNIIETMIEPLQIVIVDSEGKYHMTPIERRRTKAYLIKHGMMEEIREMLRDLGVLEDW